MNRPSTVNNPERIRFESWVGGTRVWKKYKGTHKACHLRKSVDGQYLDYRINDRWIAWNAALKYVMPEDRNRETNLSPAPSGRSASPDVQP